jgi:tRNA pseudouridine38-40 synthase
MPDQRTIEGDLFQAFVGAGAISKSNADDPKKSSLVRCARTDKGVHAAGNVISLKLIIEDPDIVAKINSHLAPQIRVWGIHRTTGGFSCYAACDSRWYEYLIPTYAFLPPHPSSYLAKQLEKIAAEDGKTEEAQKEQHDVLQFWENVERHYIQPILQKLSPEVRDRVEDALYKTDSVPRLGSDGVAALLGEEAGDVAEDGTEVSVQDTTAQTERVPSMDDPDTTVGDTVDPAANANALEAETKGDPELQDAIKAIRQAYITAKKAYRISTSRLARVQEALGMYVGTHNYHNFTIKKSAKDPSSKRFIKSFKVNGSPVIIKDSEWLSLKVHGQSFMMHQIRKMVGMAALVVRCGSTLQRMNEAMTTDIVNIPKAPGLGLLLERPVFDGYNDFKAKDNEREKIDFTKYESEILAFKQSQIYDRIFEDEEKELV